MPKRNREEIQITLEMLSDWHIGSGGGITGDIDSLIKRDHNELPYIPAKTLTGIWRDACELVAQGLDNNIDNGNWQKWVDYLFGDQPADPNRPIELSVNQPHPAALSIRAAHLPKSLSNAIISKDKKTSRQLKDAITFTKPGIKIHLESGCAEKDCLRLEEKVRMGAILTADCTLEIPNNEAEKKTAYALLIAGAAMVERLGGNRRRGSGRCRLILSKIKYDLKNSVEWIEQNSPPPAIPKLDLEDEFSGETISHQSSQNWVFIPLKIILHSPLIISKRTVGNVVETLDYIPGTHLLRLVTRKLGKLGVKLTDAITKGDLLITNATIEVNSQRGQPIPFALFYEKLGGGFKEEKDGGGLKKEGSIYGVADFEYDFYSLAIAKLLHDQYFRLLDFYFHTLIQQRRIYNRLVENEPKGIQLKGYRSGYIAQTDANLQPKYATVPLTLGTHNTIEDQYQRPTSEVGGVYSYEAIKVGTILRADIRLHQGLAELLKRKNSKWWELIEGYDSLGQSKKDDYGNVEIKVLNSPQLFNSKVVPNDKLYVWLLSDLLLRDKRLRPTVSIQDLAQELTTKLGVKVIPIDLDENEKLTLIARQNRLDSWQVRWGLARPSLVGLGAGTCIVFNINKMPELNKLTEIEASGIGERTAEGYGQICFNHPLLTQPFSKFESYQISNNNDQFKTQDSTIKAKDMAFEYAHLIERAAWKEEIQRQATAIASEPNKRTDILGIIIKEGESQPSMSQLGALRSVISRLQSFDNSANIAQWINSVLDKPNRSEKWNNGSLENIRNLVTESNIIWQRLEISTNLTLTQNAKNELQNELWSEAVRTLINACILAHKRDLEKAKEPQTIGV